MTGSLLRTIARLFKPANSPGGAEPVAVETAACVPARHLRLRVPRIILRLGPSLAIATLVLALFPTSVVAATGTHFSVTGASLLANTGVSDTYSITALDVAEAVVSDYSGTVDIVCSDVDAGVVCPAHPSVFSNGVATVAVTLVTTGAQTITAHDAASSMTGVWHGTILEAGAATRLVVDAPATASVGSPASVTVTARSDLNVTDATYGGTVSLTSSDVGATIPSTAHLASGTATFDITFSAAGSQTITATDPSPAGLGAGTSGPVDVGKGSQNINFTSTAPSSARSRSASGQECGGATRSPSGRRRRRRDNLPGTSPPGSWADPGSAPAGRAPPWDRGRCGSPGASGTGECES